MYRPRGGVIQVGLEIPGDVGLVCRRDVCTNAVKSQRADGSIVQSIISKMNPNPFQAVNSPLVELDRNLKRRPSGAYWKRHQARKRLATHERNHEL